MCCLIHVLSHTCVVSYMCCLIYVVVHVSDLRVLQSHVLYVLCYMCCGACVVLHEWHNSLVSQVWHNSLFIYVVWHVVCYMSWVIRVTYAFLHVFLHVSRFVSHDKIVRSRDPNQNIWISRSHDWIVRSFAEYRLFYRALLQKRSIILRSLLIVATPYVYRPLMEEIRLKYLDLEISRLNREIFWVTAARELIYICIYITHLYHAYRPRMSRVIYVWICMILHTHMCNVHTAHELRIGNPGIGNPTVIRIFWSESFVPIGIQQIFTNNKQENIKTRRYWLLVVLHITQFVNAIYQDQPICTSKVSKVCNPVILVLWQYSKTRVSRSSWRFTCNFCILCKGCRFCQLAGSHMCISPPHIH